MQMFRSLTTVLKQLQSGCQTSCWCSRPSIYLQAIYVLAMLFAHFLYARDIFSLLPVVPSVPWWHE